MKHLDEKSLCLQPPDVTERPYKYNASLCESREVCSNYGRFSNVVFAIKKTCGHTQNTGNNLRFHCSESVLFFTSSFFELHGHFFRPTVDTSEVTLIYKLNPVKTSMG